MENNDILRRLRFTFDYSDSKMIELFAMGNLQATRAQVSNWLKKDDDPQFVEMSDRELAMFLNGFIVEKRGKKDGPQPTPEDVLTNNIILRKLKIALNFIDEDIIETVIWAGLRVSKHEISAFFRKPSHVNYVECGNQFLRNFLQGLQKKYRDLEG